MSYEIIDDKLILDSSDKLMNFSFSHYPISLSKSINEQNENECNSVNKTLVEYNERQHDEIIKKENYKKNEIERYKKAKKIETEKKLSKETLEDLNILMKNDTIERTQRLESKKREEIIRRTSVKKIENNKREMLEKEFEKLFM